MTNKNSSPSTDDAESTPDAEKTGDAGVSRRGFLRGLSGSLATAALSGGLLTGLPETEAAAKDAKADGPETLSGTAPVTLTVNNKKQTVAVDTRRTLLELLRSDLDLTGTKQVCNHGSCGACTVIADGRPIYSCMMLAIDAEGKKIETVEGLAPAPDKYHPLQTAFVEHDALMCGFCTPGFLMASKALLDTNKTPNLAEVKNACAGNLCRCGTYPRIFEAVLSVAKKEG